MFVVHASRIERVRVPPAGFAELCDRVVGAFRWAEPLIAAAFLFIAGYSLVLSHLGSSSRREWLVKIGRRCALLYALSVALFVPQYGIVSPDLLVSSGVLSAIALSIAIAGLCLITNRPGVALLGAAAVVLAATAWLDASGATVTGLNAGPGGAFPLVAFTLVGAAMARRVHAGKVSGRQASPGLPDVRALIAIELFLLTVAAVVLVAGAPWLTERVSLYPAASASSVLGELLRGEQPGTAMPIAFWNHSALGALALLAPLGAALIGVLVVQRALPGRRLLAPLLLLGRSALLAYVTHLLVLGLLDAVDLAPQSAPGTLGLVLLLAAFCGALGHLVERRAAARGTSARTECDRAPA
jgi:uncharacterized membrane protein